MLALLLAAVLAQGPYKDGRQHPPAYHGPGREEPEPPGLTEVRIGYFGPTDDTFWTGASLALEKANREGGYKGKPFRLVAAWSPDPWRSGASHVVRLAYNERVWAVVGSVDGAATHLAEQVAAKALFPLVDPASTDLSVNHANVPWVFSCLPSDTAIVEAMGAAVVAAGGSDFVLISGVDHDSRVLAKAFRAWFDRRRITPRLVMETAGRSIEPPPGVKTALVIADAKESARIVRELPLGMQVFGGPGMARRAFIDAAGAFAQSVRVPLLAEVWAGMPDYAAAQAYDAVSLLVAAIRKAGLNRARIRDALAETSPWHGQAGEVRWDVFGRNQRAVRVGTIVNGRLQPLTPAAR